MDDRLIDENLGRVSQQEVSSPAMDSDENVSPRRVSQQEVSSPAMESDENVSPRRVSQQEVSSPAMESDENVSSGSVLQQEVLNPETESHENISVQDFADNLRMIEGATYKGEIVADRRHNLGTGDDSHSVESTPCCDNESESEYDANKPYQSKSEYCGSLGESNTPGFENETENSPTLNERDMQSTNAQNNLQEFHSGIEAKTRA